MKLAAAYMQSQAVTLSNESAFEELYTRLSRWAAQAAKDVTAGDRSGFEALVEKCLSLLGFMDRCIDVSGNYEIASRILSLHRFAINALVRAKAERDGSALTGLPEVFVSLAEIFVAIRTTQAENYKPAGKEG
jgi:flagellin-specific chaperone FliS